MSPAWSWSNWTDWYWLFWMGPGFFIVEFWALFTQRYDGTLTAHLRPMFAAGGPYGPIYWLSIGLWLWLGFHIFIDRVLIK